MKVLDAYFLTQNTEDHADILTNVSSYSKETGSNYLFCYTYGILSSNNDANIEEATDYFTLVLNDQPDLLDILLKTNYALVEFSTALAAMDFREMYFLNKDEIDISEKYMYCCVFDEIGAIVYENVRTPKTEKAIKLTDIFTAEELKLIEEQSITY